MIPGIDISHWQQEIDWSEVKRSGVKFAFIKATEFPDKRTTLFIDDQLKINIKGAAESGIHWGAYHFFRTHIDPVIQAKVFCETVGAFNSLPPVLDLEAAGSKGERLNYKVQQFLEEVERITGRKPIIYSSGGFWRSYMAFEKQSHTNWARQYPLWIAQYTTLWPTPLYPWAGWDFWQYSDKGRIPGVITNVDMNWFNGSIDDLEKRFVKSVKRTQLIREVVVEQDSLEISDNPVSKHTSQMEDTVDFKGDFQEPNRQHRHVHVQRESEERAKKAIRRVDSHQKEEEWIKNYFLRKSTA